MLDEIRGFVPDDEVLGPVLYDLMLDYPMRDAKGLRPALCIATCRALGGHLQAVLRSAAVLELYHNAFLIHDDVEDGSPTRRGRQTLHREHGVPVAVNVGDAMLALALTPLLENMEDLGMGRALRVMQIIARMARESAEGQAMELAWISQDQWEVRDADYLRMVHKKSSWYTFLTPMLVGAVIAGADDSLRGRLGRFATPLGGAFQIQDDLLSLEGDESQTGKRWLGDIEEGKRTLPLLHYVRHGGDLEVLRTPASRASHAEAVLQRMRELGSLEHARKASRVRARRAARVLDEIASQTPASVHLDFLSGVVAYVVGRER